MGLPPADNGARDVDLSGSFTPVPSNPMISDLSFSNKETSRPNMRVSTAQELADQSTIFGRIATDDRFQHTTLSIIVINALWIGTDTEWNHKNLVKEDGKYPLEPTASVIENIFCVYFTAEVIIRFLAFKKKYFCIKDAWFVFDSLLVTSMVVETWVIALIQEIQGSSGGSSILSNLSCLRLLRLLRLTRMARLMRSVPELLTLVKGMVSAVKSVFFILLFLVLVMYIFAIIFTSVVGDPDEVDPGDETAEYMFQNLWYSMMTLFTNGVLGDNLAQTVQSILDYPNEKGSDTGVFLFWLFFLFFAISSMTLLNMLIGVLCEVVTQTAESEQEATQIRDLRLCLEDAFDNIDKNGDGLVCQAEWSQIKSNPDVRSQLASLGVEQSHMDERLDMMQATIFSRSRSTSKQKQNNGDERSDGLTLEDLILKVIEIRPCKPASALDVEILKAKVLNRDTQFKTKLNRIESLIEKILARQGTPVAGSTQMDAIVPVQEAQPAADSDLHEIPTQLLLHEIKMRAQKVPPGRGHALNNNLTPGSGAVSYTAIKNACRDLGN